MKKSKKQHMRILGMLLGIAIGWIIVVILILCGIPANAQDTTRTPIGYEYDYPYVYVRTDTIHGTSFIYNHYPHKMYFSVNGGKATLLQRRQVMTVWSNHFTLIVSRKYYKRIYNI